MRRQNAICDAAAAEEGYADLHRAMDRKPYPSPEGLRNVQRLMALRSPKVGELKIDNVTDNRLIRRLDESGFIDKAYAAQGTRSKPWLQSFSLVLLARR